MKRIKLALPAECLDLLAHFANEERASVTRTAEFLARRGAHKASELMVTRASEWADAASMLAVAIATRDADA